MTKYSTDSGETEASDERRSRVIKISVTDWLVDALKQITRTSGLEARNAIRKPLEYAVIEWHKEFEQNNQAFEIPGEHAWKPDFRCRECKSANEFLFREVDSSGEGTTILCLNCDYEALEEEFTRLSRASDIQDMKPYSMEKEGTKLRHQYEGQFRTPMRFRCTECSELDLILPDPETIEALICPRCGNKGDVLLQVTGPVVKSFEKYPPDKYHTEPDLEDVGRGISRGKYDDLEKSYKDSHER